MIEWNGMVSRLLLHMVSCLLLHMMSRLLCWPLLSRGTVDGLDRFRDPQRYEKGRYALLHRAAASGEGTVTLIFNDAAVLLPAADEAAPTGQLADRTVWKELGHPAKRENFISTNVELSAMKQGLDVSTV
jgi:hypothetical protein